MLALVVLGLLALKPWRPTAPGAPDTEIAAAHDGVLPAVPGAAPDRSAAFLEPVIRRLDPGLDGWDTEVLSARATDLLATLAKRMSGPVPADAASLDAASLDAIAAVSFESRPLRPSALAPVHSDDSIVVLREDAASPSSTATRHRGAAGLAAALADLRSPFAGADDLHVKFKVVRVDPETPTRFRTSVLYQASGRTPAGIVQQNADWECRFDHDAVECRLLSIDATNHVEVTPGAGGSLRFADVTQAVLGHTESFRRQLTRGVDHWRGRLEANHGVDPNGSQGIALGDADGDGLDDLFVCQQGGLPNRLYLQNADGTLRDASSAAGVDWMEVCRSALLVDLDNDGDQDLVMAQGWYLMVMTNDGSGVFTVAREERSPANVYSCAAADYDNDGDLDLFYCGRNPGREMEAPEGILGTPIPYHDANNGGPNILWENDGRGGFTDVTGRVGFDVNNRRYTFAAAWDDYDNDGDMDLYVANDYGRNNLYRNDEVAGGRRIFRDVAAELGVEDISAGMSVAWGDYDNDGLMDVYVSNMFSSAGNRIAFQRRFRPAGEAGELEHFRRHARGNTLFRNLGGAGFEDVSVASGVTMGRWAWGSKFVDLNNDGHLDIYVTNGYITTEDTGDL